MMNRPAIIAFGPQHPGLLANLHKRFDVIELSPDVDLTTLPENTRNARAITSFGTVGASADLMNALPNLEIVALCSVGYDKVDVAHAQAKGIYVTNTPDVLTDDVADLALGLLIAVFRKITASDRMVRSGAWAKGATMPLSRKLTGSKIGILGLGRIGKAIADRVEPFAGSILYHGRHAQTDISYRYVDTPVQLARESDVLIVATAGGSETAALVGTDVLDALGPDGVIINIARGSVIDEAALVSALSEGRIGGAGLDVFVDEPHVPEALFTMDNVVLQPHQGSATKETRAAMADLVLANLDAHFAGRPLLTPVV